MISAFVTLFLVSHALHVSEPSMKLRVEGEFEAPTKLQYGTLEYSTTSGWNWLGPASGFLRSVMTGKSEIPQGQTVVMRAHHRSGTQLAKSVSDCIADHADPDTIARVLLFPEKVAGDFTDESLAVQERPTLHFVREPAEWLVSWYLFAKNLQGKENWKSTLWLRKPGSMMKVHGKDFKLVKFLQAQKVEINATESVNEFLNRVPQLAGLAVAYHEMSKNVVPSASTFAKACKSNSMCKQICLEPFLQGESSYMSQWQEVFKFAGVDLDANSGLKECIKKQRKEEVSPGNAGKEERALISQLDKQLGGDLQKVFKEMIHC